MKFNGILTTLCNIGMKKIIICGFVMLFSLVGIQAGFAQNQQSRQEQFERIEAEKIAFITKELQLTPKEAQRFFPLYNEYRKAVNKVMEAGRERGRQRNQENRRMDDLAIDTEILAIKKEYRQHFAGIIGAARASRFFEVEREFREKLFQELRRRGGGGFDH